MSSGVSLDPPTRIYFLLPSSALPTVAASVLSFLLHFGMTLHPMPLIYLPAPLKLSALGNPFSVYLASPLGERWPVRAGEGQHDVAFTSAHTSFLFPPVPHPRELLLCDAEAERGSVSPSRSLPGGSALWETGPPVCVHGCNVTLPPVKL